MKLKKLFIAFCGLLMVGFSSCANDDITIKYSELPAAVKQFTGKHFAGYKVKTVRADKDDAVTDYDIYFTNGTKLEIDANGAWQEVSNATAAVPVSMLPDTTLAYLTSNYPDAKIVKVEKDRKGYEVKLANGTELEFDATGAFFKIDR